MKLYAPEYYKNFECIADRCSHSCCIGWEIDIDSDTYTKYTSLTDDFGKKIAASISETDGTPHFNLVGNDRCPHLNESGLCNIILNLGETYLCEICREHPRFYNKTSRGIEVGLGLSCEEACRLVLSSDDYTSFYVAEETSEAQCKWEYNAIEERNKTYSILSDRSIPYTKRLETICREYSISLSDIDQKQWLELINSLEYLYPSHKEMFAHFSLAQSTPPQTEVQTERFLAYLIYRHCSSAENKNEYCAALFLAMFCEKLLSSITANSKDYSFQNVANIARIISEEIEYSEENTDNIKYALFF